MIAPHRAEQGASWAAGPVEPVGRPVPAAAELLGPVMGPAPAAARAVPRSPLALAPLTRSAASAAPVAPSHAPWVVSDRPATLDTADRRYAGTDTCPAGACRTPPSFTVNPSICTPKARCIAVAGPDTSTQ